MKSTVIAGSRAEAAAAATRVFPVSARQEAGWDVVFRSPELRCDEHGMRAALEYSERGTREVMPFGLDGDCALCVTERPTRLSRSVLLERPRRTHQCDGPEPFGDLESASSVFDIDPETRWRAAVTTCFEPRRALRS
jgi:hypothetical protein